MSCMKQFLSYLMFMYCYERSHVCAAGSPTTLSGNGGTFAQAAAAAFAGQSLNSPFTCIQKVTTSTWKYVTGQFDAYDTNICWASWPSLCEQKPGTGAPVSPCLAIIQKGRQYLLSFKVCNQEFICVNFQASRLLIFGLNLIEAHYLTWETWSPRAMSGAKSPMADIVSS